MLVADYNSNTLMIFLAPEEAESNFEEKKGIVRIYKDGKTLAYNFPNFDLFEIKRSGPLFLDTDKIKKLNKKIVESGFKDLLEKDELPKFVIAYVKSIKDHPKSDHLKIASVEIAAGKIVEIVSGSPNIKEGIKTVACLPGAILPSGMMIWPGKLRGVDSYGMMAAPRELGLKNAPDHPGMIVLPDDFGEVGEAFDFAKGDQLEFDK